MFFIYLLSLRKLNKNASLIFIFNSHLKTKNRFLFFVFYCLWVLCFLLFVGFVFLYCLWVLLFMGFVFSLLLLKFFIETMHHNEIGLPSRRCQLLPRSGACFSRLSDRICELTFGVAYCLLEVSLQ